MQLEMKTAVISELSTWFIAPRCIITQVSALPLDAYICPFPPFVCDHNINVAVSLLYLIYDVLPHKGWPPSALIVFVRPGFGTWNPGRGWEQGQCLRQLQHNPSPFKSGTPHRSAPLSSLEKRFALRSCVVAHTEHDSTRDTIYSDENSCNCAPLWT